LDVPTPPDGIDDDDDAMVEEEEDMTVMDATEEGPSFFCMVVGIDRGWIRGGGVGGPTTTINPQSRVRFDYSASNLAST
jgi:hypothetical protein